MSEGEGFSSLHGHTLHRTSLVAKSPLGCFSVDLVAHLDGQGNGMRSVSPSTYRLWGVPVDPPPLRVEVGQASP
ncbi:hypothetical protein GCM10008938_51910 [Deinococcus roseus]|uniref:Uncharacterized protein n=1 Tax=Deinococcus roseus TaxID=392414 RepID=A0ABQ2DJ33_9DEIO|nr:hypothetical protein GCM10008938_51910 [Deinococcus roseus]